MCFFPQPCLLNAQPLHVIQYASHSKELKLFQLDLFVYDLVKMATEKDDFPSYASHLFFIFFSLFVRSSDFSFALFHRPFCVYCCQHFNRNRGDLHINVMQINNLKRSFFCKLRKREKHKKQIVKKLKKRTIFSACE